MFCNPASVAAPPGPYPMAVRALKRSKSQLQQGLSRTNQEQIKSTFPHCTSPRAIRHQKTRLAHLTLQVSIADPLCTSLIVPGSLICSIDSAAAIGLAPTSILTRPPSSYPYQWAQIAAVLSNKSVVEARSAPEQSQASRSWRPGTTTGLQQERPAAEPHAIQLVAKALTTADRSRSQQAYC